MMQIPGPAGVTNKGCLEKANETITIYSPMRREKPFFGHVVKREALENIVMTGKISGGGEGDVEK